MADMTELEQMKAKLAALKAAKAKLDAEKTQQSSGDNAPKAEVKVEAKPEVKEEPKAEAKTEVKEEPKAEAKTEVKEESKAETKPEVKEESKAEAKTEEKHDAELAVSDVPAVRPATKAPIKPSAKPAVKQGVKPGVKPGVRPMPHKPAHPATPSPMDDPEYRAMLRRKARKINFIIIGMTCAITLIVCGVVLGLKLYRGYKFSNPLENKVEQQAQKSSEFEKKEKERLYGQEGQEKQEKPKDPFVIAYEELRAKLDPKAANKESALEIKEALLNNIKLIDEFLQQWRETKSEDKLFLEAQKMRDTQKSNYDFYDEE